MLDKVKAFLAKYSLTFHSLAVVTVFLVGAFNGIPQFHDLVMKVYDKFPQLVKDIVVSAILLIGYYKNFQKTQ